MTRSNKQLICNGLSFLAIVSVVALGWLCFALDVQVPREGERRIFMQSVVVLAKKYATEAGIVLSCIVVGTRILERSIRPSCASTIIQDRLITEALDRFRRKVFPDVPNTEPKDRNRVTVFKHVNRKWWIFPFRGWLTPWGNWRHPYSGWLVVWQRSGHLTQRKTAVFLAPDDATQSEGIAGMAWRGEEQRVGHGTARLPDLSGIQYVGWLKVGCIHLARKLLRLNVGESYNEACRKVKLYADSTNTPAWSVWHRIRQRKACPTSILSTLLVDGNGEPWGVLVMDSSNDHECIETRDQRFRDALSELSRSLRRYGLFGE